MIAKRLARFLGLCCAFALAARWSPAEGSAGYSFSFDPSLYLPTGVKDIDGENQYSPGGGARLAFTLIPSPLKWFGPELEAGEEFVPVRLSKKLVSLSRVGLGLAGVYSIGLMDFRAQGHGGWYYGLYDGTGGGNLYYDGSLTAQFKISAALRLGMTGGWRTYVGDESDASTALAKGPFAGMSVSFYPENLKNTANLKAKEIHFDRIFPTLLKYYDTAPIGWIEIVNSEPDDIRNVSVSVFIPEYMDEPTKGKPLPLVRKGGKERIDLYALLNDKVLTVTEGMLKNAKVTVEYSILDKTKKFETTETVSILDRNALTWDDTRKAAAFVTAKDPALLEYAKQVASLARSSQSVAGDMNLRIAIALFEAMSASGIKYVTDPKSSYATIDENSETVDFMQFPTQTIKYRSGDCDDLTTLYCALLESVGVSSAMITVPGHIFPAFALSLDPSAIPAYFSDPSTYFVADGVAWVPVEATILQKGFFQAWHEGARELKVAEDASTAADAASAELYPVHDSWKTYEPIGFIEGSGGFSVPANDLIEKALAREYEKIVADEMPDRERELIKAIEKTTTDQKGKLYNKLGILYSRYGKYQLAEKNFALAAQAGNADGLVNGANVMLLTGRYKEGYAQFKAALKKKPDSLPALKGLAICADNLGYAAEAAQVRLEIAKRSPADAQAKGAQAQRNASMETMVDGAGWEE